jgi:putative peptidoglycan lipid II flippase
MTNDNYRVAKYTSIVMLATLLCRVLGLGREMVISNKFGAGLETDAFFVAFMIPNLLRSFLGEGALNTTFIPVFSDYLALNNQKKADSFASNVLNILIIVLVIIIILGILGAPIIVNIVASGFRLEPEKFKLTVHLTKIMFPYIGFAAIAALFMGVLNSYKQFFIPAFAPAMLNIGIIFLAVIYSKNIGIYSLAIGVIIGGLFQMLMHIPALIKKHFNYKFIIDFNEPGIRTLFGLLMPAMFGLAIDKINFVVDRIIASYLAHGSISALYYANRLMQFPLGVFGIALSIAILPTLSKNVSKKQFEELKDSFNFGIKILSFFILPSTVGLIILSTPVVRLFYEHGVFSSQDTRLTEIALVCYTVGLFAMATLRLVISTFYALKDTRTPLKIGIVVVILNIILDLILVRYLAHAGIALATSIAAIAHLIILGFTLDKKVEGIFSGHLLNFFWKICLASIFMGVSCWLVSQYFSSYLDLSVKIVQFGQVALSIVFGLIVYYCSGIIFGIPEFKNAGKIIGKIIKGSLKEEDIDA